MERKYRQRGYHDSSEGRERSRTQIKREDFGPKVPRMPAKQLVSRCARCGKVLAAGFDSNGRCLHCGFELHSCKQCAYFDTSARFECTKPILARIPKKDSRNECTFYSPRVTLERQTSRDSSAGSVSDPRKAFEALFKK
jgi:hypothetical protein